MVDLWERHLSNLAAEAARIKAGGQWCTGARTLMQVLKLHQLELPMVALLGWTLAPEGHHGLGNRVVRGLFRELSLSFDHKARVYLSREEPRMTPDGKVTRADLVVRVGKVSVLVEAKNNAEQHSHRAEWCPLTPANPGPRLLATTRRRPIRGRSRRSSGLTGGCRSWP